MRGRQGLAWQCIQKQMCAPWGRLFRAAVQFLVLAVLTCSVAVYLPHQIARGSAAPSTDSPSISVAQTLLQQGIAFYEAEHYTDAIASWTQALAAFAREQDHLNQALVQSNLSLAHQQLGQWQDAEAAIDAGLALLPSAGAPQSAVSWETQAKVLNTYGRLQWARGALEAALEAWRQAETAYRRANQPEGVVLSQINQSIALQGLGLGIEAERQLVHVDETLQQMQLSPAIRATSLWHLGNAHRRLGQLERSLTQLQAGLAIARSVADADLTYSLLLDLGNTERALGNRAIAIGEATSANQHVAASISNYRQAVSSAQSSLQRLQAQSNALSLMVQLERWEEGVGVWVTMQPELERLPASRATVYAQLNVAQSLMQLDTKALTGENRFPTVLDIAHLVATAAQHAKALNDPIATAYALGQLGHLYEQTEQWEDAQHLTQEAVLLAEQSQSVENLYRWQWQLGRILKQQGNVNGAIASYTSAVETLESIRSDLLFTNADVQFSFRDNVEPIYRGMIELLLRADEPSQENLQQALRQMDRLQLSELENFLRCNLAEFVQLSETTADTTTATIHPILLPNRLDVIVSLPQQPLWHYSVDISEPEVVQRVEQFRAELREPGGAGEVRQYASQLYDWLIAPLEAQLEPSSSIDTLVFVLDGPLRNIPMSVLYDSESEQYVIEKYAIALTPGLQLLGFEALERRRLNLLAVGVSEAQRLPNGQFFPPLPNVEAELNLLQATVPASEVLLNQDFTQTTLQTAIDTHEFTVVHMATHGQFSSDPDETFILTYNDLIRGGALRDLIRRTNDTEDSSIELLVLSACQTAQGDRRATLGLAGLAVTAGARSTLATLWRVGDESTTTLMERFYQALIDHPELSKAKVLQQVQQSFLTDERLYDPFYWAPYVLVGNWL